MNKNIYNFVILKGVFRGLIMVLLFAFILALFTFIFSSFNQELLDKIIPAGSIIIILYVGYYIARNVDSMGWLNGGLGGMMVMGIIILTGSFNITVTAGPVFLLLVSGLLLGGIGGMIGINT